MLTVITPTCGRDTLWDTLTSIFKQEGEHETIVIGDGYQALSEMFVKDFAQMGMTVRYVTHGPTRNYGNDQRTFGQGIAHGTHIVYLDDDDILTPEAFRVIRKAIAQEPEPGVYIFKCVSPWGEVVWTDEGVYEQGNICTIQLVVENPRAHRDSQLLPAWPKRQGGNVPWTRDVARELGVSWRQEIISIARPRKGDLWWSSES